MSQEMKEVIGGIDANIPDNGNIITISGGINVNNNHIEKDIVIGNKTKIFVKNKFIEWDSFKSVYFTKNNLPDKYYDKLLKVAISIITFPIYTECDNNIVYMAHKIYNESSKNISNAIIRNLDIYSTFKQSVKYLFMSYKLYIERLIERFLYLKNNITGKQIDFDKMVNTWGELDIKNRTNSSSIILFFNFPPRDTRMEKNIPRIEWKFPKKPKYAKLNKLTDNFLRNSKDFQYLGYCPYVSIDRLLALIKFPARHLRQIVCEMEVMDNSRYEIKKKYTLITKEIISLGKTISKIKQPISPQIKKKKLPKKLKGSTQQKVKIIISYIEAFLKLYKDISPDISKKERQINKVSGKLCKISKGIQEIIPEKFNTMLKK